MLAGDANVAVEVAAESESQSIAQESARELVLVDASLADLDELLATIDPSSEIVLLDAENDFVDQVSSILRHRAPIDALHLVTHGQAGGVVLGDQTIDAALLESRHEAVREWRTSFKGDADILLYGCHSGSGAEGQQLLSTLARLTAADVAASTDRTGSVRLGGDWVLERSVGGIETRIVFSSVGASRYKHTLDVTVSAAGSTGEEVMQLLIDNQVVRQWIVGTEQADYNFETSESISASSVKVRFLNDLYQPELGVDRNLIVDKVTVDGVAFESEDQRTYSTGTWLAADGVTAGFGRGEILHANGVFQYDTEAPAGVQFDGRAWNQNPGTRLTIENEQLSVRPTNANGGVAWTTVSVEAGTTYKFSVDGYRDPQITFGTAFVGVDFFNAEGVEIDEAVVSLTEQRSSNLQSLNIVAPDETAYATIWVYAGEQRSPRTVVARINSVSLDATSPLDTTPPTAEFTADGATFTEIRSSLNLGVRYVDDFELQGSGRIRITGPNGFDQVPPIATGVIQSPADQTLVYFIRPTGENFTAADNGVYTVSLLENTALDTSGNATPAQVLGTFTLDIGPPPVDLIPPTARLTTTETSVRPEGFVEFSVEYEDDRPGFRFGAISERYIVEGPGFASRAVSPIAGGGSGPNSLFEVIRLTPDVDAVLEPGEYFVSLVEDAVFDLARNPVAAGPLGSFRVV